MAYISKIRDRAPWILCAAFLSQHVFFVVPILAATLNWSPGNTAVPQAFHNPNNWSPAQVPTALDVARFEVSSDVLFTDDAVSNQVHVLNGEYAFLSEENEIRRYDILATLNLDNAQLTFGDSSSGMNVNVGGAIVVGNNEAMFSILSASGSQTQLATNEARIGSNGSVGTLQLTNGAELNTSSARIATFPDEDPNTPTQSYISTVLVKGEGTSWINSSTGSIVVGDSFNHYGMLRIEDGGIVSTGGAIVANRFDGTQSGGGGEVRVQGEGSQWSVDQTAFIGLRGKGILLIDSGGIVTDGAATLGELNGAEGQSTVSGMGAAWNNEGILFVGNRGEGLLTIEAGGIVANTFGAIGFGESGTGTATVTGDGSIWNNSDNFAVGQSGQGSLTISNGGEVFSVHGFLGYGLGSSGSAVVTGTGSRWKSSGNVDVGEFGQGALLIENGGVVQNVHGFVGYALGSSGKVTIQGEGSTWTNGGNLVVGGGNDSAGGPGTISIYDQGRVEVGGTLRIWNGSEITLDGGTLKVDSTDVINEGTMNYRSGTIHLIDSDGYTVGANSGPIDRVLGFEHVTIANGDALLVDESLTLPTGTSLSVNSGSVGANEIINNDLIVAGNSLISSVAGLTNRADLVAIDSTIEGPVHNSNGSTVTVVGTVNFEGLVSGSGIYYGPGTAKFNGGIAPGASPAEVAFEGNIQLTESNTLFIEIGGTTLGEEYDSLSIAGTAELDGILSVSLVDFTPSLGQQFSILTASSITDHGLVIGGPASSSFKMQIDGSSVILEAVGPLLPGDYNNDGIVNAADYTIFRDTRGQTGAGLAADGDSSGTVDDLDHGVWSANFGYSVNGEASYHGAVPEPASLWLLSTGLASVAMVAGRRKRKRSTKGYMKSTSA